MFFPVGNLPKSPHFPTPDTVLRRGAEGATPGVTFHPRGLGLAAQLRENEEEIGKNTPTSPKANSERPRFLPKSTIKIKLNPAGQERGRHLPR